MSVGPVEWGAHAPEDLERVAAVFLAQDYARVVRRRPSSGDGGVDVLVPNDGGWHVHQVKSFTGRMAAGRRSQVAASIEEVRERPRLNGRRIARWSLVVPIDPTSGEQKWFEELTSGLDFPCDWAGALWWESMATRHPHVVDYYFRDGQQRVARRIEAMTRGVDLLQRPPTALDVAVNLDLMRSALDAEDPHYRYEFHLGDLPQDRAAGPADAVMLTSARCEDGRYWTVFVIPKHADALRDSPIRGNLTVTAFDPDAGIDIRQQIEDFRDYGCAFDIPRGALSGELIAPGGLAGELEGAAGQIEPMPPSGPGVTTRLRCTGADGSQHELVLKARSQSSGERGGFELKAADDSDLLSVHLRLPPQRAGSELWLNVALADVSGRPVRSALPVVRLYACAKSGGELEWMEEHGTGVYFRCALEPALPASTAGVAELLAFLELLGALQGHVRGTVTVPEEITASQFAELEETVAMIRDGELRGTWSGITFTLHAHVSRESALERFRGGGAMLHTGPMAVSLGAQTYDLGGGHRWYAHAVLAERQPLDPRQVAVVPGPDATTIQRLGELAPPAA